MRNYIIVLFLLSSCSNNDGNKVTYYEPHNNCATMAIMDSSMNISKIQNTGDADYDLANAVKIHHNGGIAMAQLEVTHGKKSEMRDIAKDIENDYAIIVQSIDSFFGTYKHGNSGVAEFNDARRVVDKMQHTADLQLINDDNDHDFGTLILPHLQCAIDLADIIQHHSQDQKLSLLASRIKDNSILRIEQVQQLLLRNIPNRN